MLNIVLSYIFIGVLKLIDTLMSFHFLQGMDLIEKVDPQGFHSYLKKYGNTICGRHPIAVLLHVSESKVKNIIDFFLIWSCDAYFMTR